MRVGDLVKIKEHYHLQLGQNPIGLILSSFVNKRNGFQIYEVQLFGANRYDTHRDQRVDQFAFYGKDLEVFKKLE
jgi:hypothetical protein